MALPSGYKLFSGEEINAAIGSGGGGGGFSASTTIISQTQLQTMFSQPVQVIPAPAANQIIQIVGGTLQYYGDGTGGYPGAAVGIGPSVGTYSYGGNNPIENANTASPVTPNTAGVSLTTLAGSPMIIFTAEDGGVWGAITSSTITQSGPISTVVLDTGGTGYAIGDTGLIQAFNGDATYLVDTVGDSGAVVTFTMTDPGSSYTTGSFPTTTSGAQPGSGTGFTVNVTAILPGGSGYVVNDYGWLPGGSEDAFYVVDSVNESGAVLTYHLSSFGTSYQTASGVMCNNSSGFGGGLTLDITVAVATTGSVQLDLVYNLINVGT